MDPQKRAEIIQKLAAYILQFCPLGALREPGEKCDVALCYPRKDSPFSDLDQKAVADGRLLDLPIQDIKAVASSKVLARLVGADRTSFLVRQKGESRVVKGVIRLSKKDAS